MSLFWVVTAGAWGKGGVLIAIEAVSAVYKTPVSALAHRKLVGFGRFVVFCRAGRGF